MQLFLYFSTCFSWLLWLLQQLLVRCKTCDILERWFSARKQCYLGCLRHNKVFSSFPQNNTKKYLRSFYIVGKKRQHHKVYVLKLYWLQLKPKTKLSVAHWRPWGDDIKFCRYCNRALPWQCCKVADTSLIAPPLKRQNKSRRNLTKTIWWVGWRHIYAYAAQSNSNVTQCAKGGGVNKMFDFARTMASILSLGLDRFMFNASVKHLNF